MIIYEINTKTLYEINASRAGENYMQCPACSNGRKKKSDKCLCWNADKQVGYCHHCKASFIAHSKLKQREAKTYILPEWKNKTGLTDKALKWFEGRMITQRTINRLRIYSDTEYMPQFSKNTEVICFPYFMNGNLVNIKYRGAQKSFKMVKDAELIFYNFDAIKASEKLIICEGEIDALTFIQCGYEYVVSVPNGAAANDLTYLDNYIDELDGIGLFYIAADFDDAGLKLRNELVRRLGAERCRIVTYKGLKDANELYCKEGFSAINEVIYNAPEVQIEGVMNISDRYDNIYSMFKNGLPRGEETGIGIIDEHIRWQTGRLAIWTGIASHGKSEFLDFVIVRLNIRHGWKTLYFSPENYPLEYHFSKIAEKIIGKQFMLGYMSDAEYEQAYDYIEDNFFWLEPYENATIDSILDRAKQFVRRKGIRQLVIDPFNCLEHKSKSGENTTEYIGRFLDELTRFAKQYNVLVHLVAHPTKMPKENGKYAVPTMNDISGSIHFNNKADYGISIYRDFNEGRTVFFPLKIRFKNLGQPEVNGIKLQYNFKNGRYAEPVNDILMLDNSNYLNSHEANAQAANEEITDPFAAINYNEQVPF